MKTRLSEQRDIREQNVMLERENRETLQELSAAREEVGALTEEVCYLCIQNCIFIIAIPSLLFYEYFIINEYIGTISVEYFIINEDIGVISLQLRYQLYTVKDVH